MARRKTVKKEPIEKVETEEVVKINKVTDKPEIKEVPVVKKRTPKAKAKDEVIQNEGKLYCRGHFTYHDAKEFGKDKRYCTKYLAEKNIK